ncbi:DNA-directed RNA polymerase subunit omega [Vallitalea guaymasensis]|uniref:DNA-directed RNA polymerase subunit omega n=1 Tax=Vallitalea guaymasensis TaxID=1185412 RepID=UPI000DE26B7D|nr:DNA-directed RNA polymerase subunit omega [Vallitalea guaymasensis]
MLHPSYTDLMTTINDRMSSDEEKLKSRYSIVIASAKRAREIIGGDEVLSSNNYTKPLSNAVNELYEGKIDIVAHDIAEDDQ